MTIKGSSNSNSNTVVRLLLITAAAIVLFALVAYYNSRKSAGNERFSASLPPPNLTPIQQQQQQLQQQQQQQFAPAPAMPTSAATSAAAFPSAAGPAPLEPSGNEKYLPVGGSDPSVGNAPINPFPQDRITPEQLLPKDAANSKWAQVNPAGQGDVKDQNFLTAGYHLGFDTQGSSLRNASHDFRSTPPNPRFRISVWQQSTIEPDMSRRPLE